MYDTYKYRGYYNILTDSIDPSSINDINYHIHWVQRLLLAGGWSLVPDIGLRDMNMQRLKGIFSKLREFLRV